MFFMEMAFIYSYALFSDPWKRVYVLELMGEMEEMIEVWKIDQNRYLPLIAALGSQGKWCNCCARGALGLACSTWSFRGLFCIMLQLARC